MHHLPNSIIESRHPLGISKIDRLFLLHPLRMELDLAFQYGHPGISSCKSLILDPKVLVKQKRSLSNNLYSLQIHGLLPPEVRNLQAQIASLIAKYFFLFLHLDFLNL
ncbi:hypothetical protein HAX54_020312 [Datura stramonium]|uniref:Uncharacterized protein n=1 Tax=Datura stramonium TaxID=4076 RepID=A0ABS8UT57_DATST|nr:hypothetical protein [Datura stramonium]